jgi:hypothetical protein
MDTMFSKSFNNSMLRRSATEQPASSSIMHRRPCGDESSRSLVIHPYLIILLRAKTSAVICSDKRAASVRHFKLELLRTRSMTHMELF